jgi:NADPH:quinone reductase-like Zn-dependent oxidoreductase
MRALVQDRFVTAEGSVRVDEVDMPDIGDDQVLVRVRAGSAKMYGWDLPAVVQSIGRLVARVRTPTPHIPGLDLAGEVEAVGVQVTGFQPGDAVFGWSTGALADYVSVTEEALVAKPANVGFAEAATVAMAGLTALQALRKGRVEQGDEVLIIGASGGVGTFAVQLAKARGATVTGVCSTGNLELVRSLGADHIIDYTKDDFARGDLRYDVILDMAGNRSLSELRRALRSDGTLIMVGQSGVPPSQQNWFRALSRWLRASIWSWFIDQQLIALIQTRGHKDLVALKAHIEANELAPVVTATYPLEEAPEAIAGLNEGHGRGRVVIEF